MEPKQLKKTSKVKDAIALSQKVFKTAKAELNAERESNLKERAKQFLLELDAAEQTVKLLKRQINQFMQEVDGE